MKKKKIKSLFIIFFLFSISFSSIALTKENDEQETMLLIRINNTIDNFEFIKEQGYDILGMKPAEWIDTFIVDSDRAILDANDIDYTITISDVDEHCNSVRGTYHTFPEIETILQDIANNYPSITSLYSIGQSYEGRDIWCLEITDNPGVDEGEPGVFYMGLHHAREWPTVEICLHIADELTSNYGSDPDITDVVDNRRLWLVTCENPDGYVYSHDQGNNMWRKNRRYLPEYGTYGIDANRNYAGSSNGDPEGAWGSIGIASVTHSPSSDTYCGPGAASEACTQAIVNHFIQEDICALITWHTYSELVLWPYAYSYSAYTPDDTYLSQVGTQIAGQITQQDGTGTYTPQKASSLYPTTGDTTDWVYGYSHYVKGKTCFPYTIEACTSFQPSESYLDQICEENFDGALYMLQEAENIDIIAQRVVPPIMTEMDTDSDGEYTVSWTEKNPDANPEYFQLDELTGLTLETDDVESGTNLWNLDGFSSTTTKSNSATHSYTGQNTNGKISAMTSVNPLPVTTGMTLEFWTWYDLEDNYDMGFVEVSTDGRFYEILEKFNGNSNGWEHKQYSLDNYTDQSIFIRFRQSNDENTLGDGFYVDDITPVPEFATVNTISDTITSHSYLITGNTAGEYYYRVKGYNTDHGWGDFSILESMNVTGGSDTISIEGILSFPLIQETTGYVNVSCRIITSSSVNGANAIIVHPDQTQTNQTMSRYQNSNLYYLNQSYSQLGTYDYHIWAKDDTNQKSSMAYHFYIGPDYKSIAMIYGWNLMTVPVETSWMASDLIDNITGCLMVSWFDAENQTFRTATSSGGYDFQLLPGWGYFTYVLENSTFAVSGPPITNVNVPLEIGWNMIGWFNENETLASDLMNNITGCIMVSWYDAVNETYRTATSSGGYDFTITQGMGVFVYTTQTSIWNG